MTQIFKRNRSPAGSVERGQCLAVVWTHISLSQPGPTQPAPVAAVLKRHKIPYYGTANLMFFPGLKCMLHQALTVQIFDSSFILFGEKSHWVGAEREQKPVFETQICVPGIIYSALGS